MWGVVFGNHAEVREKFRWCDWGGVERWVGHGGVIAQAVEAHSEVGEIRVAQWAYRAEGEMRCVPMFCCSI